MRSDPTYFRLIDLLEREGARYRLVDHEPAGRTELASLVRGHPLSQAAKCIVIKIRYRRRPPQHVLAVVPGNQRVDMNGLRTLFGGDDASMARREKAEELTGAVSGSIPPFSFDPRLQLVADPLLLRNAELFFNAARLDRSLALATADYVRIARPRIASIAQDPWHPAMPIEEVGA